MAGPPPSLFPFERDPRGNKLELWTIEDQGRHHLWLRGPGEVAAQVMAVEPDYCQWQVPSGARWKWTHVLTAPGGLRAGVQQLLEVLGKVISLPTPPNLHTALALDWYKRPIEGVDSFDWPNTEIGDLVNCGKYRYKWNPERQAEVGRELVDRMCDVIDKHLLLRGVDVILDVPGHDSTQVSFGSRMAATVAKNFSLPTARVNARDQFRPPAKNLSSGYGSQLLSGHFFVGRSLSDQAALIVDDVFRSGDSMNEAARAALHAGVVRVHGFAAVRTMRR